MKKRPQKTADVLGFRSGGRGRRFVLVVSDFRDERFVSLISPAKCAAAVVAFTLVVPPKGLALTRRKLWKTMVQSARVWHPNGFHNPIPLERKSGCHLWRKTLISSGGFGCGLPL
jgi:hypothetical protein